MRVDNKNMRDAERRIREFIKTAHRLPKSVKMKDMDTNKDVEVGILKANGMFYSDYMFWLTKGRHPNYVTENLVKPEPTILNFQDNKYNCCPASVSMISTKLFYPLGEPYLAVILGTNTKGTKPELLMLNLPKTGLKIVRMTRNPVNVKRALDEYKGVLCHYETGPADCSGFVNNYGHYCVIKDYINGKYLINDPTQGQFWCRADEMDKATNGRALYYYAISLY